MWAMGRRRGEKGMAATCLVNKSRLRPPQPPSGEGIAEGVRQHLGHRVVTEREGAERGWLGVRRVGWANLHRFRLPQPPPGGGIAGGVKLHTSHLGTKAVVGVGAEAGGAVPASCSDRRSFAAVTRVIASAPAEAWVISGPTEVASVNAAVTVECSSAVAALETMPHDPR